MYPWANLTPSYSPRLAQAAALAAKAAGEGAKGQQEAAFAAAEVSGRDAGLEVHPGSPGFTRLRA